jgi:hypothetical protein
MSEQATERRLQLGEIAALLKRDGAFKESETFSRQPDTTFVPWSVTQFRKIDKNGTEIPVEAPVETPADATVAADPSPEHIEDAVPPPPPPPGLQESGPSPDEIIRAIEAAREEGRARGYQEGLAAARHELQDALAALRRLEAGLVEAATEASERNAVVVARHVRRIAQDLAGTMLAEMPQAYLDRIKRSADLFTGASSEFSLALNPRDAALLAAALKGDELFSGIKVIEDGDLVPGAYRLLSRDLEYEDAPRIEGVQD